ncbi:MAG: glycoside hydrolase family 19 protein [Gallionella sp.]|jgi:putative chitinase
MGKNEMTPDQLVKATGCKLQMAIKWTLYLNSAMARFMINTPARQAAFIAQIAHESGRFEQVEENLHYSSTGLLRTFPKYFNVTQSLQYAGKTAAIASRVYANRMGNKAEISGDGYKYRGRGLIQITGHDNYVACGNAIGLNLEINPDMLTQPEYGALSAAWFWTTNGCNELADRDNFAGITKRINGGLNGQAERLALFERAETAFA